MKGDGVGAESTGDKRCGVGFNCSAVQLVHSGRDAGARNGVLGSKSDGHFIFVKSAAERAGEPAGGDGRNRVVADGAIGVIAGADAHVVPSSNVHCVHTLADAGAGAKRASHVDAAESFVGNLRATVEGVVRLRTRAGCLLGRRVARIRVPRFAESRHTGGCEPVRACVSHIPIDELVCVIPFPDRRASKRDRGAARRGSIAPVKHPCHLQRVETSPAAYLVISGPCTVIFQMGRVRLSDVIVVAS